MQTIQGSSETWVGWTLGTCSNLTWGFLCASAKINLCQTLLQIFSGQSIVCILVKHELQNQEIHIFQNRCIAVHRSLPQIKALKYGMKSDVRFENPEQFMLQRKTEGALQCNN